MLSRFSVLQIPSQNGFWRCQNFQCSCNVSHIRFSLPFDSSYPEIKSVYSGINSGREVYPPTGGSLSHAVKTIDQLVCFLGQAQKFAGFFNTQVDLRIELTLMHVELFGLICTILDASSIFSRMTARASVTIGCKMKLSTDSYKGARDFYPEDKRLQKYLFGVMRAVCERYGYEEYDAPILEPTDLYLQKGNQEIINEQTYTFTDRGDRSVTMRTEMTPSVARMVAGKRQELGYPLRWYSIPQCWRYERTQRGRGREFYQLNVDIFGDASIEADVEAIRIADDIMKDYGASADMYDIRVSSRELLRELLRQHGFDSTMESTITSVLDSYRKPSFDKKRTKLDQDSQTKLIELLDYIQQEDVLQLESGKRLASIIDVLEKQDVKVTLDPTITRGFDYYTGMVFEVFDTHPDNNRSMYGGGRYDNLLEAFGAEPLPTVGFGMGDHTLQCFLELHELVPALQSPTEVYVIAIGQEAVTASQVATELRSKNINTALDSTGRKLEKCIKTADKKSIPFVLFVGETERKENRYTLRRLSTGEEVKGPVDELAQVVFEG